MLRHRRLLLTRLCSDEAAAAAQGHGADQPGISQSGLCAGSNGHWKPPALTVLAMVTAALARLALVAVKSPRERPRVFGLIALILSVMVTATAVGVASSGVGPDEGLTSRYVTLAAPLLTTLYVTWLMYTPVRIRGPLLTSVLVVVCLSMPDGFRAARIAAEPRLECFRRVERSLMAGRPDHLVLDQICPTLCPVRKPASIWLCMLRTTRFGKFGPRGDPDSNQHSDRHARAVAARTVAVLYPHFTGGFREPRGLARRLKNKRCKE